MGLSLKWTPIMALFYVGIFGMRLQKIWGNKDSLWVTLRWGWDEAKYTQIMGLFFAQYGQRIHTKSMVSN